MGRLLTKWFEQTLKATGKKAYVVDDSVLQHFCKQMPGISSHFDHTFVLQVLT